MFRRLLVIAAFVSVIVPSVAQAQTAPVTISSAVENAFAQPARAAEEQFPNQLVLPRPSMKATSELAGRSMMTSLYATTAAMQMMDVHSTIKALNVGAIESNPLMGGLVKNRAAFLTTKAAMAAVTIYAAHKMAKNNKLGAALTLVAINSAYAMIVKNNYKIAGR